MPVEPGNGRILDHFAVITYDNKQINSVYFQGQTRKVYHNTISVVDNFSQPQNVIWYGDRPYRIDLY
jgi:hypothetical protein